MYKNNTLLLDKNYSGKVKPNVYMHNSNANVGAEGDAYIGKNGSELVFGDNNKVHAFLKEVQFLQIAKFRLPRTCTYFASVLVASGPLSAQVCAGRPTNAIVPVLLAHSRPQKRICIHQ